MIHPKLVELLEGLLDASGENNFTLDFSKRGNSGMIEIVIRDGFSEIDNVLEKDMNSALISMMEKIDGFMMSQSS